MELTELMSAFAEKLGIEGIAVENGTCSLTIDDIPMEFTESPDGLAVVGGAVIGEPPPEKREEFYEMLLRANTQLYGTQGIALGESPDTGEIILIGGLPFKAWRWRSSARTWTSSSARPRNGARRWRTSVPPRKKPPSATRKRPSSPGSAGTAPAL